MFRIKTDIRQIRCETKDKVEKLIRNWVIRPNDLIYDNDDHEWAPIGAHPAFVGLFGILDEQERNTPDTVVTAQMPVNPHVNGTADPDEVTRLVGRPLVSDSEAAESEAVAEADADVDDARETDVFDEEEVARSMAEFDAEREAAAAAEQPLDPPAAPDGIELPARDGEVTMMTERTMQMLTETDETDQAGDELTPDEVTVIQAAPERDEVTAVRPHDTGETADEPSVLVDPEIASEAELVEQAALEEVDTNDVPRADVPKLGRHNLPEELFATNEISSPEVQEHLKRLDELADLTPSSVAEDDEEDELAVEPEKRATESAEATEFAPDETDATGDWPNLQEDSAVDEAWQFVADDLRTTEELDTIKREQNADSEGVRTLSVDALDEEEQDKVEDAESEDEDEDEEDVADISLEEIPPPEDFISDGYNIPLPYPVMPTDDDVRRGLPNGMVSEALKDRTYPLPTPRKLDHVYRQTFDLSKPPPRDRTAVVIGFFIFLILVIAISVANC